MPDRRTEPQADPDFADEHTRPSYADEPSTETPDESVPTDRGGAGGMDMDGSRGPLATVGAWLRKLLRRRPDRNAPRDR